MAFQFRCVVGNAVRRIFLRLRGYRRRLLFGVFIFIFLSVLPIRSFPVLLRIILEHDVVLLQPAFNASDPFNADAFPPLVLDGKIRVALQQVPNLADMRSVLSVANVPFVSIDTGDKTTHGVGESVIDGGASRIGVFCRARAFEATI